MIELLVRQIAEAFAYEAALRRAADGAYWDEGLGEWVADPAYLPLVWEISTGYYAGLWLPDDLEEGELVQLLVRDSRSFAAVALVDLVYNLGYYDPTVVHLVRPNQPAIVNLVTPLADQTIFQVPRAIAWEQDVRFLAAPDLTDAAVTLDVLEEDGTVVLAGVPVALTNPLYRGQPLTGTLALTPYETDDLPLWEYTLRVLALLQSGAVVELVPTATIAMFEE